MAHKQDIVFAKCGGIAQSVEQGTENPCVTSSILVPATIFLFLSPSRLSLMVFFVFFYFTKTTACPALFLDVYNKSRELLCGVFKNMRFKFSSAFFLSFECYDRHIKTEGFDLEHEAEGHFTPRWFNSPELSNEPYYLGKYFIKLERQRQSLPDPGMIRLIRINFPLVSYENQARMDQILHRDFSGLTLPAKIYISAHCTIGSTTISQLYIDHRGQTQAFSITARQLASILQYNIPSDKHHDIVFHLISCSAQKFAGEFIGELYRHNFRNVFVVSYKNEVIGFQLGKSASNIFRVKDFSTDERTYIKDRTMHFIHHSEQPDVEENKILSYLNSGRMVQIPYHEAIKAHSHLQLQKKNFFMYDHQLLNCRVVIVSMNHYLTTAITVLLFKQRHLNCR